MLECYINFVKINFCIWQTSISNSFLIQVIFENENCDFKSILSVNSLLNLLLNIKDSSSWIVQNCPNISIFNKVIYSDY